MDNYLITGSMGFLGSHLAQTLLKQGKTVWGIDLAEPPYQAELLSYDNFHFVLDTIKNEEVLGKLIDKADCVCHLAAIAEPLTYVHNPLKVIDITMQTALRIAELTQLKGKLFFYTSSSEVYGRNPKVPWAEDDDRVLGSTAINRWCYSTGKAAVEHAVIAAQQKRLLDFVIVRLFNVYGPRLRGRVLHKFIDRALIDEPLIVEGDGRQTRSFTYVEDAVDAFIRLIETPAAHNRVYNVGHTEEYTVLDLVESVKRAADRPVRVKFRSYEECYGCFYEDIMRRVPDVSRIHSAIGWKATTPLDHGVKLTYDYEKQLKDSR